MRQFLVLCPGGLEDYATEHVIQGLAPARTKVDMIPSDMAVCDPSKTNIGAGKLSHPILLLLPQIYIKYAP